MRLELETITVQLRRPYTSAHGELSTRELVLVLLHTEDGVTGRGEAAPLPSYDGVSAEEVRAALTGCREVLAAGERIERGQLLARCAEACTLPQALAALDLALWDMEGRRAGAPVWRLLGVDSAPAPIPVNWTVASPDRAGAAAEAAGARTAGYGTVKVKVGTGDDAGRLAAVRAAAGPGMRIRIDANGAWTVEQAAAALRALAPVGLELCEEPVHGAEGVARLGALTEVPLALDESAHEPGALERRACALVCLKIATCGGISGLLAAAERASRAGYEIYLASTLDGPLGIAAALHAAAALRARGQLRADRACGLATLSLFGQVPDPLPGQGGTIAPPRSAGLLAAGQERLA